MSVGTNLGTFSKSRVSAAGAKGTDSVRVAATTEDFDVRQNAGFGMVPCDIVWTRDGALSMGR